MYVGSGERVTNAVPHIKVRIQNFRLFGLRQFCECLGGSVSKGAANAKNGLKRLGGIDKDADLRFQRLAEMFEFQSVSCGEPVITLLGGSIDRHLSTLK